MSNIIFGPVHSRRFGKSLGIDLSPTKKQCNFDCLYCELDPAKTVLRQDEVVSVEKIIEAVKEGLLAHKDIDVLTITANGEPTLYPDLDKLIDSIEKIKGKTKTLILSNASTIDNLEVQKALMKFDEVKLSLDCATQKCLKKLDRSHPSIKIESIKKGMLDFWYKFKGSLIIEILMVEGLNDHKEEIDALNAFLQKLQPTRIDLGTIDRPPAYNVKPIDYRRLYEIAKDFDASLPLYVASRKKAENTASFYTKEQILQTLQKRPLSDDDIAALLDKESQLLFKELVASGSIRTIETHGVKFYKKA